MIQMGKRYIFFRRLDPNYPITVNELWSLTPDAAVRYYNAFGSPSKAVKVYEEDWTEREKAEIANGYVKVIEDTLKPAAAHAHPQKP